MPPLTEEQFNKAREAGFTTEEIIGFEKQRSGTTTKEQPKSQNQSFLPNANRVENLISQRQDPWKSLIDELNYNPNPLQHPIDSLMKIPTTALKLLGVPWGRGESALASAGLAAQKGEGGNILTEMLKGASGKRQAQLGDIVRTTGFGGGANELISSLTGMGAMAGVGEFLTTGKMGLLGKGKTFRQVGSEAGQELGAMGNAIKGLAKKGIQVSQNAIETIKNIPDKLFRGGLNKVEALRVESQYGSSNGSLVDVIKKKLNSAITTADQAYQTALVNAPEGKQINIRPAIEQAGKRLKRLGLVTEKGNLTELGQSEIAQDSVYGKLLDFYKSANSISGVEKLQGKALTQGQMVKAFKADYKTLVNKDQFTFLRDKLNALYKNKPSDIDVSKVVNQFYQDGENAGIKGLQNARALTREAFVQESKFLNKNTGDLKIATEAKLSRIGTDKPLSRQEMEHIRELQKYIKHPIETDATKINKLNAAKDAVKEIKKTTKKWALRGAVGGTAAGIGYEIGKNIF